MKKNKDLDIIDQQFLTAVDTILAMNQAANKPITTEIAIGKIIYPNFRYLVKHIRNREKRVSQAALCRFIKAFDVDANFFYDPQKEFKLLSSEQLAQKVATQGMLKKISNDTDRVLRDFMNSYSDKKNSYMTDGKRLMAYKESLFRVLKRVPHYLIETVYKDAMELFLEMEATWLDSLSDATQYDTEASRARALEKEVKSLQKQLQEANREIIAVQKSENELLKKYLNAQEK